MDNIAYRGNGEMSVPWQAFSYKITSIVIAGILAALTVNLLNYYGPRFEGALFPVARATETDIEILQEPNKIRVSGTMSKYRNCDLISTTAYIYDAAGNRVVAKMEMGNTIQLRPVSSGVQWGPWRIDTPLWGRRAWLNVVTVHQCHPLWVTQSDFLRAVIE